MTQQDLMRAQLPATNVPGSSAGWHSLRAIGDFALGLAIFSAGVAAWSVVGSPAAGVDAASFASFSAGGGVSAFEPWSRQIWSELFSPASQDRSVLLAVTGVAVAAATVFNMALIRHLRQTYAAPRRQSGYGLREE